MIHYQMMVLEDVAKFSSYKSDIKGLGDLWKLSKKLNKGWDKWVSDLANL